MTLYRTVIVRLWWFSGFTFCYTIRIARNTATRSVYFAYFVFILLYTFTYTQDYVWKPTDSNRFVTAYRSKYCNNCAHLPITEHYTHSQYWPRFYCIPFRCSNIFKFRNNYACIDEMPRLYSNMISIQSKKFKYSVYFVFGIYIISDFL